MAEKDSRSTYRSRRLEVDDDEYSTPTERNPRNRTYASGPYHDQRSNARYSTSALDDRNSDIQAPYRSTRTVVSPRDDLRSRDEYRESRQEQSPRQSSSGIDVRTGRTRGFDDFEIERPRVRARDYMLDDRPRRPGAPYVIDTRVGDVIDISVAGRSQGRLSDRDYERELRQRSYEDFRKGNTVVADAGRSPYSPSGVRSPRASSGRYRDEREEDWRLVDSMRDSHIGSASGRSRYNEPSLRARTNTFSSEDSYVMVSPSSVPRHREPSSNRSAIARTEYAPSDVTRRRSRSISFRDSDVYQHDASERQHERPGAEAQIVGQYMRRSARDYDDDHSDTYAAHQDLSRRGRPDSDRFAASYRERDEPYGPQVDYTPKARDRSRRRRRVEEENDDASYYSENITRKVTRESRR